MTTRNRDVDLLDEDPPRSAGDRATSPQVRGGAVGVAVLAYFALAWTAWGSSVGLPRAVVAALVVLAGLLSASLVVVAVSTYRRADSLRPGTDPVRGRAVGRRFALVVAAEFVGLALVAVVLAAVGDPHLVPAVVCAGVGVHFFPLARLFRVSRYHRTGAALCAVAVATAVIAPLTDRPALWTNLPGFAAAATLYLTCAASVRALRSDLRPPPP